MVSSRRRRRRPVVGAALLATVALLGAGPSSADEPDDAPMVGEAVVLGVRPRRTAAGDPTASATVVSAEQFAGEAKGVAEMVATAPGVAVADYGGLGQFATASIRASTANGVLVLLDGLPIDSPLGGAVNLASIPRHWIDLVEVIRGAEGAHYGSGSLGGVVNVVTRRPTAGAWRAEGSAGSFGTAAASGDAALAVGPATLFVAGGGEWTDGGFPYAFQPTLSYPSPTVATVRENNGFWRAGAMGKVGAPVGGARLDGVLQLSAERRELPGSAYHPTPGDWQADGRVVASARLSAPGPVRGLLLAGRLSARAGWLDTRIGADERRQRDGTLALATEARLAHGPGILRLALEAQGELASADGLAGTRTRLDVAAALSDDLLLWSDRIRVAPAIRAERSGPFRGISAKLGASARLIGPVSLRASGGSTFRAPTEAELHLQQGLIQPNPDLVPEEGMGGDAAVVLDSRPLFASAGVHATLYRELFYYQKVSFEQVRPFNAGKVLVRGLELEAASAPLPALLGLSLSGAYTLLDTEFLRGDAGTLGNEVPHRARHRLYARAAVAPGPATAHVELHYVGRQWTDANNSGAVPAALTWNAGAGLRVWRKPAVRLAIEVRNLVDDRTLLDPFLYPLPGRTVLLTVRAGSPEQEGHP